LTGKKTRVLLRLKERRYIHPSGDCTIGPETLVLYGDGDSIEVTAGD
jgi:hypothetical protein